VRVSHPRTGMGVEFTEALTYDRRTLVEELIARLKSSREVPKIFVGRKKNRHKARSVRCQARGTMMGWALGDWPRILRETLYGMTNCPMRSCN